MKQIALPPAIVGVAVLFVAGCGRVGNLSEVEGIVLLNNKPLPFAEVVFVLDPGIDGPSSSAVSDAEGRFKLKTDDGRVGAVVGKYRVTVRTTKPRNDPRAQDNPHPGQQSTESPPYIPISEIYGKANDENPLGVVEVTADRHTYDLNLK